ncbi:MAG: nuclear transport factor 2 family protein [Rhodovibrionaceae bacterium]|nr:nuclear transport factor 2 family protein [Rhodovibrionaceae bacterium]
MTTTTAQDLLELYFAAWNEDDRQSRKRALDKAVAEDVLIISPTGRQQGREALHQKIEALLERHEGLTFHLGSPIDTSGRLARFNWSLVDAKGPVVAGEDIVQIDASGHITAVIAWGPDSG